MPFAATRMDPEIVLLSEVSQSEKVKYDITYIRNLKKKGTNELIYKTETNSQTQKKNLWLLGVWIRGRYSQGIWDGHVHTTVFKMDNQQGPTVQNRELCSMLTTKMGKEFEKEQIHVYV